MLNLKEIDQDNLDRFESKNNKMMNMKSNECLQWPILFIFFFWWKANTPVVRVVAEV